MVRKNFFCFSSWATLYIQNAHQILLVRTEQSSRRNHTVSLKDMGSFINNVIHLVFQNGVKSIQAAAYNGARTICTLG